MKRRSWFSNESGWILISCYLWVVWGHVQLTFLSHKRRCLVHWRPPCVSWLLSKVLTLIGQVKCIRVRSRNVLQSVTILGSLNSLLTACDLIFQQLCSIFRFQSSLFEIWLNKSYTSSNRWIIFALAFIVLRFERRFIFLTKISLIRFIKLLSKKFHHGAIWDFMMLMAFIKVEKHAR
jgi:hypothetical protein